MSEPGEGPGAILREARVAMEISPREVAEALNLPVQTIESIEANDYERLPAAVFTRGYIRAYARLLELEPDPIVARYPAADEEAEPTAVAPERGFQQLIRNHPRRVLGGVAALLVLLLIGLVVWLRPTADEASPPAGGAAGVTAGAANGDSRSVPSAQPQSANVPQTQPPDQAPEPALPDVVREPAMAGATTARPVPEEASAPLAADTTGADQVDVDEFEAAASARPPVSSSATPAVLAGTEPASLPSAAETPPGVRRISPSGDDRLWFQFSEDCWVAIKSASGESLYSDLSRGGRTLELVGQAPFRVLLGYAPGVQMSFNGETVVLAPHTRNNVATLVLGQ